MLVYHVIQVVEPHHNTSYKTGRSWVASYDTLAEAESKAELYNSKIYYQAIGLSYIVSDAQEETDEANLFPD